MPLNSIPPTVSLPDLELKRQAAQGQCFTDVAFWAGVIPGNEVIAILDGCALDLTFFFCTESPKGTC